MIEIIEVLFKKNPYRVYCKFERSCNDNHFESTSSSSFLTND